MRQPDSEIRSGNRVYHEKYVSWKIMQKMKQEDLFQTSFCFIEKLCMKSKQVVDTLFSICFGSPWLGHTIKTKCMKLQTVDSEICSILISQKKV